MIEFYQAYADYDEMMKLTERIVSNANKAINNKNEITFMGNKINLKTPFKIITMKDAVKKFGNIDVDKLNNQELIERFELFIGGFEISNGYSELNHPIVQRNLLEEQAKELREGVEEANPMDEDFIRAIEQGMPPTGGVGIGTDRLTMVLTGSNSIKDVILFPMMKN